MREGLLSDRKEILRLAKSEFGVGNTDEVAQQQMGLERCLLVETTAEGIA